MQVPTPSSIDAGQERRAAMDALADGLLQVAIRHQSLGPEEAFELAKWDLATIAEYLALLLQKQGVLSIEEVTQLLAGIEGPDH